MVYSDGRMYCRKCLGDEAYTRHLPGTADVYGYGRCPSCKVTGPVRAVPQTHALHMVYLLNGLTADQRKEVFAHYCTHCGTDDPQCRCWDDS